MVRSASCEMSTMHRPVPGPLRCGPSVESRLERHAGGPQVLRVGVPDLVVGHGADEPGPPSELGQAHRRVGHRAAGDEPRGVHDLLDRGGLRQVDQGHRPLGQPHLIQHLVRDDLEYVQQRRPDGHKVQLGMRLAFVHGGFNRFVCMHGARTYSERGR